MVEGANRQSWADIAKGLCMVLVVLWHTSLWFTREFGPTVWTEVGEALMPLRMPLFFFVSGYFAYSALRRPLRSSRARLCTWAFLYVLWTAIYTFHLWVPLSPTYVGSLTALDFIASLLLPTGYWYLYALVVFFVVTWGLVKLLKSAAPWALIPIFALALAACIFGSPFDSLIPEPLNLKTFDLAVNFFWFYLATQIRPIWDAMLRTANLPTAIIVGVVYVAAYLAAAWFELEVTLRLPLSVLALIMVANLLPYISPKRPVGSQLNRIGNRTIDVYVFHPILISLLGFASRFVVEPVSATGTIGTWLLPPLIAVGLVVAAYALGAGLRRSPLRWMLIPPAWVTGRKAAVAPPAAGRLSAKG